MQSYGKNNKTPCDTREGKHMTKIAILASDNMMPGAKEAREDQFELTEQMGKIGPAFAALGMEAEVLRWREAGDRAGEFAAMLPLFIWDYFEPGNLPKFLEQIEQAATKTKVFNSPSLLRWNTDKRYLEELQAKGAPVIPSKIVERVREENVAAAFDVFDTDRIVIKPLIGGGAWRQALHRKDAPFPHEDELPPAAAILQPFLPSVAEEGEYSLLYFGGEFSHAVNKRAKAGDYRIQSLYGGKEHPYAPSDSELQTAQDVLATLPEMPLYARVDLLRGLDGELKLIELEIVEPYLYMPFAEGEGGDNAGAQKLAAALKARL